MDIQEAINALLEHRNLSQAEAEQVMQHLMRGEATPVQTAALLVGLRMKGETVEEITGFASVMRAMATQVTTARTPLVDTCGTGGDSSGSFNISTTSAFVVAGADVAVAKHGNRSASSQCGSADVLEELGVNIEVSPEFVGRCIDEIGIGFLYARALHGAMKHVAGTRAELKVRTVFNLLGPLTNPAGATGQVIGVFDSTRVPDLARVLFNLGVHRSFVVAGSDGLDEFTLSGPNIVAEAKDSVIDRFELSAEDVGLERAPMSTLLGGDAKTNAGILRSGLEGESGPRRDVVLFNAAAAILVGEAANDWAEGIEAARKSIDSGAALGKLDALIALTTSPEASAS